MEHSRAWWLERSRVFLSECARLIESRIGGETMEAMFLCGSFAAGDETVVLEADPVILLSDVDLVVIVRTLEDLLAWNPRRAELGECCEALMPDVHFAGRVDIGVMLPEDLKRLPARPGVYDMRERGRVLRGGRGHTRSHSPLRSFGHHGPGSAHPRGKQGGLAHRLPPRNAP